MVVVVVVFTLKSILFSFNIYNGPYSWDLNFLKPPLRTARRGETSKVPRMRPAIVVVLHTRSRQISRNSLCLLYMFYYGWL